MSLDRRSILGDESFYRQLTAIVAKPEMQQKFRDWGMSTWALSPSELLAFANKDAADWKRVVDSTGLVID